jgi:hypothetical protein
LYSCQSTPPAWFCLGQAAWQDYMVVRLHRIATNHQELGAGLLGMARGVGTPFTPYSGLMPQRGAAM